LFGCDEQGLNPNDSAANVESETGFSGTITYVSKIPPEDSLRDLRVIAVPYFPVDTSFGEVFLKVINGIIVFGDNIKSTADSGKTVEYKLLAKPQTYYYVAVVQQYGTVIVQDWRVVSVYRDSLSSSTPDTVTVKEGEITTGINFVVDFYNLPPQPF